MPVFVAYQVRDKINALVNLENFIYIHQIHSCAEAEASAE